MKSDPPIDYVTKMRSNSKPQPTNLPVWQVHFSNSRPGEVIDQPVGIHICTERIVISRI
jgi:hypothetical protein